MSRSADPRSARHRYLVACTLVLASVAASSMPVARGDAERFVRGRRGVIDVRSGLTWTYGAPRFLTWSRAADYCRSLDGNASWRLPEVDELSAMIVPATARNDSFAFVREVFGRANGAAYWSGEARTRRDLHHKLAVDEDGSIDVVYAGSPLAVRCVRQPPR